MPLRAACSSASSVFSRSRSGAAAGGSWLTSRACDGWGWPAWWVGVGGRRMAVAWAQEGGANPRAGAPAPTHPLPNSGPPFAFSTTASVWAWASDTPGDRAAARARSKLAASPSHASKADLVDARDSGELP